MKGIPCNFKELKREKMYRLGRNQMFIQEFLDSDDDCIRVADYPHNNASCCAKCLYSTIKRMRIGTVKVHIIKGEVYLTKVK